MVIRTWREVGVAHGHVDRAVPHPLLDLQQRYTSAHEIAREGVPEVVPSDLAQACGLERSPQALVELADQQLAAVALEDQASTLAGLAVERAQFTNQRLRERDSPVVLGFGRARLATRAAALETNLLPSPVDVAPLDRDLFAGARTCLRGEVK